MAAVQAVVAPGRHNTGLGCSTSCFAELAAGFAMEPLAAVPLPALVVLLVLALVPLLELAAPLLHPQLVSGARHLLLLLAGLMAQLEHSFYPAG